MIDRMEDYGFKIGDQVYLSYLFQRIYVMNQDVKLEPYTVKSFTTHVSTNGTLFMLYDLVDKEGKIMDSVQRCNLILKQEADKYLAERAKKRKCT